MRKIFWDNPYQTTLSTHVSSVDGCELVFDETIAYSFSGGQESDAAFINDYPVLGSRMEGELIYYKLSDDHRLQVGDLVCMVIDWPRRLKLMRLHFSAELILEIITQRFQLEEIGAHIAEEKSRIDFKFEGNISSIFDEVLDAFNPIIACDLPIQTGFLDVPSQRRFWKIEGFAQVSCGGTHVRSTSEVGFIKLKRVNLGKGLERIEIRLA